MEGHSWNLVPETLLKSFYKKEKKQEEEWMGVI